MLYTTETDLFTELKRHSNIYIYGKGLVGTLLVNRMRCLENCFDRDFDIKGFIDKNHDIGLHMGLPVFSFEEAKTNWGNESPFIVVAVKEESREEIESILIKTGFAGKDFCELSNVCIKEMLEKQNHNIEGLLNRIDELERSVLRLTPRPILKLGFHLVDACNLNCRGCFHFSPLAARGKNMWVADPAEFDRDMGRLKELTGGELATITLFGGEPLLHPQAYEFPYIVKKHFPNTFVEFMTNGILLPQQDETFWKSIEVNDVNIAWGKYPVGEEINRKIEMTLEEKCRKYRNFTQEENKTLSKQIYDFEAKGERGQRGQNDCRYQWIHCWAANTCIQLRNHRIYPCVQSAYASILTDFFNLGSKESKLDSIDIYQAQDYGEILDFIARPIPFCRFCKMEKQVDGYRYGHSKCELKEWTE